MRLTSVSGIEYVQNALEKLIGHLTRSSLNDACNKRSGCERLNDNVDRFPYLKGSKHVLSALVKEENLLFSRTGLCS